MPLVIVTGHPSSGKTDSANKISNYFKTKLEEQNIARPVRIVTDSDNLDWEGRDNIYMSIQKEKELRGWIRAEVQRYVNLDHIVILDAAAYIKGFRYELHCLSKEAKTQYCIVEKLIDPEICWQWNMERLTKKSDDDPEAPSLGYKRETFDALLLRYEECNDANRWDSPLYKIINAHELPLESIFNTITRSEPLAPNKSTTTLLSTRTIHKPIK